MYKIHNQEQKRIKPTPQKKVVQDKQPKNKNCIEHTTHEQDHTRPTTPEQICIKPTTKEQETYKTHKPEKKIVQEQNKKHKTHNLRTK